MESFPEDAAEAALDGHREMCLQVKGKVASAMPITGLAAAALMLHGNRNGERLPRSLVIPDFVLSQVPYVEPRVNILLDQFALLHAIFHTQCQSPALGPHIPQRKILASD